MRRVLYPRGRLRLQEINSNQPEGRVSADLRLQVTIKNTGRVYHGRAADLSSGGMSLYLPAQLEIGERLHLNFSLPLMKNLDIDAVVRNRSSYRYGIQFVDLDELQREQIRTIAVRILAYTSGE